MNIEVLDGADMIDITLDNGASLAIVETELGFWGFSVQDEVLEVAPIMAD